MKKLLLLSLLVVSLVTVSQAQLASLSISTDKGTYSKYQDVQIRVDAFNADGSRADCIADVHITNGKNFDVTWGFGIVGADYPAVQPVIDFWQTKSRGAYTVTVSTYPGTSAGASTLRQFTASTTFSVQ